MPKPTTTSTIDVTEHMLRATRVLNDIDGDMTVQQLRVLLEVACGLGDQTAREITNRMGVSPGTVSRALDLWSGYGTGEKPGRNLIDRVEDLDDRRNKLLRLTKRGEKFISSLCESPAHE